MKKAIPIMGANEVSGGRVKLYRTQSAKEKVDLTDDKTSAAESQQEFSFLFGDGNAMEEFIEFGFAIAKQV